MLNPLNFLSKFIKSSNQKELDRIYKIVEKVNSFESSIKNISNEEFPKKTLELKERLNIFPTAKNTVKSVQNSYFKLPSTSIAASWRR